MPEIKHTFAGGRMNKDLDERLVPNGEYRDALNIQVSTSEGSDVGTAQNILGNQNIQILGLNLPPEAFTVSSISDEKNDTLYWFVWTLDVDYIISHTAGAGNAIVIFRDVNKNVLKFDPRFLITGINIIDDMIFWTDNKSEPKKINISNSITGTPLSTPGIQTKLVDENKAITILDIEEKHVTVIKKTPRVPLEMKLETSRDPNKIYTGVTTVYASPDFNFNTVSTLAGNDTIDILIDTAIDSSGQEITAPTFGLINDSNGLTGWHEYDPPDYITPDFTGNILVGTTVVIKPYDNNGTPPGLPVTDYVLKGVVEDHYPGTIATDYVPAQEYVDAVLYQAPVNATPQNDGQPEILNDHDGGDYPYAGGPNTWIQQCGSQSNFWGCSFQEPCTNAQIVFTNILGVDWPCKIEKYPLASHGQPFIAYQEYVPAVDEVLAADAIPAANAIAANPSAPDPNTTLSNTIRVRITSIVGQAPLPNFDKGETELKYVVDLFDDAEKLFEFKFPRFSYRYKYGDGEYSPFAPFTQVAFIPGSFDYHPRKGYNIGMTNRITKIRLRGFIYDDMPKDVVSVDILFKDEASPNIYVVDTIRPNDSPLIAGTKNTWDRVKGDKAIGITPGYYLIDRETVNSVVQSNQLLRPWDNVPRRALAQDVTGSRVVYGNYIQNYNLLTSNNEKYVASFVKSWAEFSTSLSEASKSIKSLREYQLGVVFTDKYGRETPVISNPTGTLKLEKERADKNNRIKVRLNSPGDLLDLTHFKFFVKETAEEYYNLAMDRWYDAEDGNIWLAFPSSDRNKIDIDSFIILKKGSDQDTLVSQAARYKVIAIENEAPDFIKTTKSRISQVEHISDDSDVTTDVFDNTGSSDGIPVKGSKSFQLLFAAYHGTSGQNLETIDDTLYVSFGMKGTDEISKRYKIAAITNDWVGINGPHDEATTLQNSAGDVARYSVELDEPLGDDVNFIGDSSTGIGTTAILTNTLVKIWRYKVENLPQYDGRFFVKINYDDVFKENIALSSDTVDYRVVQSRKIYSMKGADGEFIDKHTQGVGNFLTEGNSIQQGGVEIANIQSIVENDLGFQNKEPAGDVNYGQWDLTNLENFYGYYWDNRFSSFALYFRRYGRYDSVMHGAAETGPYGNIGNVLLHLRPGVSNLESDIPPATYDNIFYPDSSSDDNSWVSADNGLEFHGAKPNMQGNGIDYNSSYSTYGGYTSHWKCTSFATTRDNEVFGFEDYRMTKFDRPKDTEVWFIDNGPVWGAIDQNNYHINPHNVNSGFEWMNSNTATPTPNFLAPYNNDIWTDGMNNEGLTQDIPNGTWSMNLGYGGIEPSKQHEWFRGAEDYGNNVPNGGNPPGADWSGLNFFNVGDWNSSGGDDGHNTNYEDGGYNELVNKFNSGESFRWREDPNQTIYVIQDVIGGAGKHQYLRHSVSKGEPAVGFHNWRPPVFPHWEYLYTGGVDGSENPMMSSMGEFCSFNFTKGWQLDGITPQLEWNPYEDGRIIDGLEISLPVVSEGLVLGAPTCTGLTLDSDLKIFVESINGLDTAGKKLKLHEGMALSEYSVAATGVNAKLNTATHFGTDSLVNEFLVIRNIVNKGTYFELWLGGYKRPMRELFEHTMASDTSKMPFLTSDYKFVQVGMNSYSDNSEFNINTMGPSQGVGKVGAVGYHMDFLTELEEENLLSENPAIWETEPKDAKDLDIYYEATGAIPMKIDADNIHDGIPIGSTITYNSIPGNSYKVINYDGDKIKVDTAWNVASDPIDPNNMFNPFTSHIVKRPDGLEFMIWIISMDPDMVTMTFWTEIHNTHFFLPWHNCYSFGNGVESDRIRDNFNLPYIENGVKVSTTLDQEYKEEHRKYGLIYSGLYNSTSGVNNLNQFIQAEKITKDINPIYGSIQKLHSRDTDLVTLCEDKCLRILSNKDAVYNADGNTNLTATENVLGQTIPFGGEYGISTNPESFASQAYRVYFTDRIRGAVMRLSKDGLTAISNHGMKDWFKDNLKLSNKIIGSYDDKKEEYNITLKQVEYDIDDGISSTNSPAPIEFETWDGTTIECYACVNGSVVFQIYNINFGMGCPSNWGVHPEPCGLLGCMNPSQYGYNPNATMDDGSCIEFLYGCISDVLALNYDYTIAGLPQALNQVSVSDTSDPCCYIEGCMSATADNYNPAACMDDGSCSYGEDDDDDYAY